MSRVLIATPQLEELEPLLRRFALLGHESRSLQLGRMGCYELPSLQLVASVSGHGKAQFALQSQYLIDRLGTLDALLCVGAAGSLVEALRLGDVVVGTTTVEHDYKLRFLRAPLPSHPATASLVDRFRELAMARDLSFGVHLGAIASGDEDVVDPLRAAELRAATGALCGRPHRPVVVERGGGVVIVATPPQ